MKILSMAWTIYDDRMPEFSKDFTGGGLVIKNLCEYIGRKEESYLFVGRRPIKEQKVGHIHFVGTDMKWSEEDGDSVRDEAYLNRMAEKFEMALKRIQPDLVHFHGLGDLMLKCVRICIKNHVKYAYTEHLYIGLKRHIERYETSVQWEKDVYTIPDLRVIAVSTGVKKKILEDFVQIPDSHVEVILNGTDFVAEQKESDYREKYQLQGKKVLLCVGTILARKNQLQLVSVYQKLPKEIRDHLKIIFCGKESMSMKGRLQEAISAAGLEQELQYVGAVSSEDMKKFYSVADGLIMPSLAEGLSIAALEMIAYGQPVIMFRDSECAEDLKDEKVVCFAEERRDESLAQAIEDWYSREWDSEYIRAYAQYFTMERMAEDYLAYYRRRLNGE